MQFIEQFLGFLQIARVEAFSGPVVHGVRSSRACCTLPWSRQRRARLMAARSSQDLAFCSRATESERSKYASAFAASGCSDMSNDFTGNSMDCPVRSQRALWSYGAVALSGSSLNSVVGVDS